MTSSRTAANRPDPLRRWAAIVAALVAVPVALGAGAGILAKFGAFANPDTEPVEMAVRGLDPFSELTCRQVVACLPDEAGGNARRQVKGALEQSAAYGDPPVTLECGTPQPAVEPTQTVYVLSGVCWITDESTRDPVWTTVDRQVPVSVTVPGAAAGSGQIVAAFAPAISENDPVLRSAPTGCTGTPS